MHSPHSEYDPNELAKITHRGLRSLTRANEPRVTGYQIRTLKSTQEEELKPGVKARRGLQQLLDSLSSAMEALFSKKQTKVTQCANYGHVLRQGWTGEAPVCVDCGQPITALDQVRGATLRSSKEEQSTSIWKRVK